ncbi:MAG: TonB-dependent receptor, partial [Desulfobacterales bacterium]
YNFAFASDSSTLTFEPEKTWNYETGIKTRFWDRKCILNAALFYIDIADKQVEEWLAGPGVRKITNAAKAHSLGGEVEMELRPWQGVRIYGGLGYSEVKFDDWVSMDMMTGQPFDYDGNELPFAPNSTYNLGFSYTHLSGFWCRADLLGNGDYYTSAKNKEEVDGHHRVNLTLGYKGESFDISLWAKNVFDEEYVTNNTYFIGGDLVEDAAPRSVGLGLTYYF